MFVGKRTYVHWQSKLTSLAKSVNFIGKVTCIGGFFHFILCEMRLNSYFIFYFAKK